MSGEDHWIATKAGMMILNKDYESAIANSIEEKGERETLDNIDVIGAGVACRHNLTYVRLGNMVIFCAGLTLQQITGALMRGGFFTQDLNEAPSPVYIN